ncbi:MAG: 2-amino-4-hydroxy-6-hydroxymethyldihydropteridine diphosphokinase [Bacteroidales bacterium]|nr:2-amino-4-hydroxy-6-hydroxymethyldihydropteridine diphosphokinase [Bacteroidales bacterium]
MNKAILGIGSNYPDAYIRVEECCKRINDMVEFATFSSIYQTEAVGLKPAPPYHNCVALIETSISYDKLKALFKDMEIKTGRNAKDKEQGLVIIDIDIVTWNNEVLRPADMERSYMKIGLKELGINS